MLICEKTCGHAGDLKGDAQVNNEMRKIAAQCLLMDNADEKLAGVRLLARQWGMQKIVVDRSAAMPSITRPGRPQRPHLVRANKMPRRGFGTPEGRAIMMHAIAHIEFNAINLALDAVQRFSDMPESYYSDWLQVALEAVSSSHLRSHLTNSYLVCLFLLLISSFIIFIFLSFSFFFLSLYL